MLKQKSKSSTLFTNTSRKYGILEVLGISDIGREIRDPPSTKILKLLDYI